MLASQNEKEYIQYLELMLEILKWINIPSNVHTLFLDNFHKSHCVYHSYILSSMKIIEE